MTRRELTDYCLSYVGAYEDHPFDDGLTSYSWTALRHAGNKKCFAFIHERIRLSINLKCEPMRGDFLRKEFSEITPAYHMNKLHWITVPIDSNVPWADITAMIDHSFELTRPKIRRTKGDTNARN